MALGLRLDSGMPKPTNTHRSAPEKARYRIRNWAEYNRALVARGGLTLWVDEAALCAWRAAPSGRRGAQPVYGDPAITCALLLGAVFHLPLRSTEGLMRSVLQLLGATLPVPTYSTLSRRRAKLEVVLPRPPRSGAVHLVVDATGLKVYGEGEWKVKVHGAGKRRVWRKLHIGVDEKTGEVLACSLTESRPGDKHSLPALLSEAGPEVKQVSGDGGYDYRDCYVEIARHGARASIVPRRTAQVRRDDPGFAERNRNVEQIQRVGRHHWKRESGYTRRSLAETGFMRLKTIFGAALGARLLTSQRAEARLRCAALNRMTQLGMPQSYPVPQPA